MSMSTHVEGFYPPDEQWQKMKAIWDACEAAGVEAPRDVAKFFDYGSPDPSGVRTEAENTDWCRPWEDDGARGFEITVEKIPANVKIIRFYNSW